MESMQLYPEGKKETRQREQIDTQIFYECYSQIPASITREIQKVLPSFVLFCLLLVVLLIWYWNQGYEVMKSDILQECDT